MTPRVFPRRTHRLPQSELFSQSVHYMDHTSRAHLSYDKAKAIGLAYSTYLYILPFFDCHLTKRLPYPDITIDDIVKLTPKFWQLHSDPIGLLDGGAVTLLTIQYNLCCGTIAQYSNERPELVSLIDDLLQYNKQLSVLSILLVNCCGTTDKLVYQWSVHAF